MKYLRISVLILVVSVLAACSKKDSTGSGNGITDIAPSNLTLTADVSTDNSGNVNFTAGASNAVSFDYDFGNGIYQTVQSGVVTYKYPSSGTYTVNVIAKSASGKTVSKSVSVTVTVTLSVAWSDEFNIDGAPDGTKWGYDLGAGGWGNNELEYYTSRTDNAIVSNGTLKIIAKKENYSGSSYTSARLTSYNKFSLKYGKLLIRAKLPAAAGTWPAIWTLGADFATNPWPACGEMDIMEQTGGDKNRVLGTIHYPGHSGGNGDTGNTAVSNATSDFHIYGLEWDATSIKISVDGVVYRNIVNNGTMPFNHNFFIILNVAMGGSLGGTVDPNFTSGTMEIDYIRYYQ